MVNLALANQVRVTLYKSNYGDIVACPVKDYFEKIQQNRYLALCWRLLLTAFSIAGIICIFMVSGKNSKVQLYYFTMQTNFFVLIMFLILDIKSIIQIAKEGGKGEVAHINYSIELFVTYGITITFLGYAIMLSSTTFSMGDTLGLVYTVGNTFVHYLVPLMAIVDFVLFMPHGHIDYKAPVKWLMYPIFYLIMILMRGATEKTAIFNIGSDAAGNMILSQYPYFFVAFDLIEPWQSALSVVALVVVFVLLGMLYIWIDKKLAKLSIKKENTDSINN